MTIELPHQVRPVRVDRVSGDSQYCRDLLAAFTLGQELHDFSFSPRYLREFMATWLGPFTPISIHHYLGPEGAVQLDTLN